MSSLAPVAGERIRTVVGMEIHVQLATRTKMFCRCPNRFGDPPNSNVCPVCLGLPGALPVINRRAVEQAIRVALAIGAHVAPLTKWDRKAYFYPDLPKNYQISQYDQPLATGGSLTVLAEDGAPKPIRFRRAHLEEDAGKNIHDHPAHTGVDLNRAGAPLLELVTEPDIASAAEAVQLARTLHRLVRWLEASEANMEMGQIRFEPNINLVIERGGKLYRTPIVEVKNLNSFRALEAAIRFETQRQYEAWLADPDGYSLERLGKQNRGFDAERGETVYQREKEEAHDYRYFPDPDLVPLEIPQSWVAELARTVGELPWRLEARWREEFGLSERAAEALAQDRRTCELFEAAVRAGAEPVTLANLLVGKIQAMANERGCGLADLGFAPERLAELASLLARGRIIGTSAARLLAEMLEDPRAVEDIARSRGLLLDASADQIKRWVEEALAANPQARSDALAGGKKQAKALGFLVGQVMQRSGGSAPPQEVQRLLREALGLS